MYTEDDYAKMIQTLPLSEVLHRAAVRASLDAYGDAYQTERPPSSDGRATTARAVGSTLRSAARAVREFLKGVAQ